MSYAVFKTSEGTLYIRDFNDSDQRLKMLQRLMACEDKISHQDDILCLLGSALEEHLPSDSMNMIATVVACRNHQVILQPKRMQYELGQLGIHIFKEREGFWTPFPHNNNDVAFLTKRRGKSLKNPRRRHQRPNSQTA